VEVFAVIYVPNFSLQAVLRSEPEPGGRAVALVEAAGTNLAKAVVLECSAAAESAGVCSGLSAPQAMARCRDLLLKPRSTLAEQNATDILLQTAYAFSPHLEHTAPGVGTIDLRGLNFEGASRAGQQTFDCVLGDEAMASPDTLPPARLNSWGEGICRALHQFGLEAQVGVGGTPGIALLAAKVAHPVLVVTDVEPFFAGLRMEVLQPSVEILGILKRWGIHTAGAFLALGREAIAARLGSEALALFEKASPQSIRPLQLLVPADSFEEQMQFEAHIETIEPLLFVLRRFIEQLSARIALTYRVVAELDLTLTLETGCYQRTFKVPSPTARVETLFRMLHTHVENLRTDAPIVALRLGAVPVRAEAQQFGLFESALRDPNHFHETLARLAALLGTERVGTPIVEPTHRPDSFRLQTPDFQERRSSSETKNESRCSAGPCLRRFRPPIRARVEACDGRPRFFSTAAGSNVVTEARGPWDASGHWWDNRRWTRQEWDVMTRDGTIYRLCEAEEGWVVEGVYD
jgi:protein ImuB